MTFEQLYKDVEAEIRRAEQQWGSAFDDKNTFNDWLTYINIYLGRAAQMNATQTDKEMNLRKALGLLVKLTLRVSNFHVAPRHYEGQSRPASPPEIK